MKLVSSEFAYEVSEIDLKVTTHFCPLFFWPKIREREKKFPLVPRKVL